MTSTTPQQVPDSKPPFQGNNQTGAHPANVGDGRVSVLPPMQPGSAPVADRPTRWPNVLGVISIVFGAGAILMSSFNFASPRFYAWLAERAPQDAGMAAQAEVMAEHATGTMIMAAFTTLLAALLLFGGIGLLRRRHWGVLVCTTWAVSKIPFVLVGAYFGLIVAREMMDKMGTLTPAGGPPPAFLDAMITVGIALAIVWGWAYPVFLLIWFSRGKIKAEYRDWAQPRSSGDVPSPFGPG